MAIGINRSLVSTADPLANDLIVSMRDKVAMLDIDTTQFTTMLTKIPTEDCKSFKEEWEEDQYLPTNIALSVTAATGDYTLSLTTGEGDYVKAGDILKVVQTGEALRVASASANSISVARGVGSVAAATAASGTAQGGLIIVGGSNEQGAEMPTAIVTKLTTNYNYTQIVRNSYRYTGTAQWVNWYSGPQLARQRQKVAIDHKRHIENTLWFGARSYASGTTGPRHTSGGILEFVSTNSTAVAGNLTSTTLQDFLRSGLEYGDRNRKVFFCAPKVAQCIAKLMDDDWFQAPPGTTVYGAKVSGLISAAWAGADVPVVVKGEWNRFGTGIGNHLGSLGVLVDMSNVALKWAPKDSRKMALLRERQNPSADETAEEYLSEFTLVVSTEKAHAKMTGVTGTA